MRARDKGGGLENCNLDMSGSSDSLAHNGRACLHKTQTRSGQDQVSRNPGVGGAHKVPPLPEESQLTAVGVRRASFFQRNGSCSSGLLCTHEHKESTDWT